MLDPTQMPAHCILSKLIKRTETLRQASHDIIRAEKNIVSSCHKISFSGMYATYG